MISPYDTLPALDDINPLQVIHFHFRLNPPSPDDTLPPKDILLPDDTPTLQNITYTLMIHPDDTPNDIPI
jgi:hypothetical protein